MRSLGADHVIDYREEDFTEGDQRYDIIFETVGKSSLSGGKDVLKEGGIYLANVIGPGVIGQMLWTKMSGSRKVVSTVVLGSPERLQLLKEIAEEGKYRPYIARISTEPTRWRTSSRPTAMLKKATRGATSSSRSTSELDTGKLATVNIQPITTRSRVLHLRPGRSVWEGVD